MQAAATEGANALLLRTFGQTATSLQLIAVSDQ